MRTAKQGADFQLHSHARTVFIPDSDPTEVRDRLANALEQTGFSIMAEMDFAEILARRLDLEIAPHFILEACHPDLAERALAVASDASLLMPCRLGVWQEGKGTTVGVIPPQRMVQALGRPHLDAVAAEVDERLEQVFAKVSHVGTRGSRQAAARRTPALELTVNERAALIDALQQRRQAVLVEAAGTEKHELQHALAQNIEQLEALMRRLEQPGPRA